MAAYADTAHDRWMQTQETQYYAELDQQREEEKGKEMEDIRHVDLGFCTVIGNYVPTRPAPPCQNHDSPAFSDPGDDGYVEAEKVLSPNGDDITALIEQLDAWDQLAELALDKLEGGAA